MKLNLILFARGVVYLLGIGILSICFILIPEIIREESVNKPVDLYFIFGFLATVYLGALPVLAALFQTHKLLNYIAKNQVLSPKAVKALNNIKVCALVFSLIVVAADVSWMGVFKYMNSQEDITPFITIGGVFTIISGTIFVFFAVIQKILDQAVEMKIENDLIV